MSNKVTDYIEFTESDHKYRNLKNNKLYISVTTLLKKYKKPFDSEGVSYDCAFNNYKIANPKLYYDGQDHYNIKQEAKKLVRDWKVISDEACEYGTMIHKIMEDYIIENKINNKYLDLYKQFDNFSYPKPINSEVIVYNDACEIAKQIDGYYIDKSDKICIFDFKTNKKGISTSSEYGNFLVGDFLNHLEECDFNIYSLQMSIYALILGRMLNKEVSKLELIHIDRENKITLIPALFMEEEARRILNDRFKLINNIP